MTAHHNLLDRLDENDRSLHYLIVYIQSGPSQQGTWLYADPVIGTRVLVENLKHRKCT